MRGIERRLAQAEERARTAEGGGDAALRAELAALDRGARDVLRAKLEAMMRRQRADPAWREPTPEESAADAAELIAFWREKFGEEAAERVAAALER